MNRDCTRCQPLLSAFVDNETSERENLFIRQHLRTCEDCRNTLESYQGIRSQFRRVGVPTPPPELRRAVLSQVRDGSRAGSFTRRRGGFLRPIFGFGSAAIGLAGLAIIVLGAALIFALLNRQAPYGVAEIAADSNEITVRFTQDIDAKTIQEKGQELFVARDADNKPIPYEIILVDPRTVKLEPKEPLDPGKPVQVEIKQDIPSKSGDTLPKTYVESRVVPTPAKPTPTSTPRPTTRATTVVASVTTTAAPVTTAATTATTSTGTTGTTAGKTTTAGTTQAGTAATTSATTATTTAATTTATSTGTTGTAQATDTATTGPTNTPEPSPTATQVPTSTPQGCKIMPVRGFGKVYSDNPDLATKIGCASGSEANTTIAYQPFEKGFMVFNNGQIWVFVGSGQGTWTVYQDTYVGPTSPVAAGTGTPALAPTTTPNSFGCAVNPINGFGKLWRDNPVVRDQLGCPRVAETSTPVAAIQLFAAGRMYSNPIDILGKRVYVLFSDGTFRNLQDTFVE